MELNELLNPYPVGTIDHDFYNLAFATKYQNEDKPRVVLCGRAAAYRLWKIAGGKKMPRKKKKDIFGTLSRRKKEIKIRPLWKQE